MKITSAIYTTLFVSLAAAGGSPKGKAPQGPAEPAKPKPGAPMGPPLLGACQVECGPARRTDYDKGDGTIPLKDFDELHAMVEKGNGGHECCNGDARSSFIPQPGHPQMQHRSARVYLAGEKLSCHADKNLCKPIAGILSDIRKKCISGDKVQGGVCFDKDVSWFVALRNA